MKMSPLQGRSLRETTLAATPMMASVMSPHIAITEQTPVIVPALPGVQTLAATPMMAIAMSPHFVTQEQTPVIVPAAAGGAAAGGAAAGAAAAGAAAVVPPVTSPPLHPALDLMKTPTSTTAA